MHRASPSAEGSEARRGQALHPAARPSSSTAPASPCAKGSGNPSPPRTARQNVPTNSALGNAPEPNSTTSLPTPAKPKRRRQPARMSQRLQAQPKIADPVKQTRTGSGQTRQRQSAFAGRSREAMLKPEWTNASNIAARVYIETTFVRPAATRTRRFRKRLSIVARHVGIELVREPTYGNCSDFAADARPLRPI